MPLDKLLKRAKLGNMNEEQITINGITYDIDLEYINSGSFASVYMNSAGMVVYFVDPVDQSRRVWADLQGEHFPQIVYLGQCERLREVYDVYISFYYDSIPAGSEGYKLYRLWQKMEKKFYDFVRRNAIREYNESLLAYVKGKIDDSLYTAIETMYNLTLEKRTEDEYVLEFPERNLAWDNTKEKIILLDCVFPY